MCHGTNTHHTAHVDVRGHASPHMSVLNFTLLEAGPLLFCRHQASWPMSLPMSGISGDAQKRAQGREQQVPMSPHQVSPQPPDTDTYQRSADTSKVRCINGLQETFSCLLPQHEKEIHLSIGNRVSERRDLRLFFISSQCTTPTQDNDTKSMDRGTEEDRVTMWTQGLEDFKFSLS